MEQNRPVYGSGVLPLKRQVLAANKKDQEFQKGSRIPNQLSYFNQWDNFPPFSNVT